MRRIRFQHNKKNQIFLGFFLPFKKLHFFGTYQYFGPSDPKMVENYRFWNIG